MIVTHARQSWQGSNKDLEGNRKLPLSAAGEMVAKMKGTVWVCKAKCFAQSFLQARTCLTSVSPSSQSKNVGERNAGAETVPGGILVGEDFMEVPVAQPNIVWWESCCFRNAEALDILMSLTN